MIDQVKSLYLKFSHNVNKKSNKNGCGYMLPEERLDKILGYINEKKFVTINDLHEVLEVSKPTIMRDLVKLEKRNMIYRVHGGATSVSTSTKFEPTHSMKEFHESDKKKKIAKIAKDFINPNETILLDSGSTIYMLAEELTASKNLTIITNDINIAKLLSQNDDIELILLGGQQRKGMYSLIGSIPENILRDLRVDKVFLGADAVDMEGGITNSNLDELNLKKIMLDISKQSILLVDSSKFNRTAFAKIGDVEIVDYIITDDQLIDSRTFSELKKKKVNFLLAE